MILNSFLKYSTILNFGLSITLIIIKVVKDINWKKEKNKEFEFYKLKKKKKNVFIYSIKELNEDGFDNNNISKICITGGPCAGKTTSLAMLSKQLKSFGYNVILVPEIATLTVESGGCVIVGDKIINYAIERQSSIMKMVIKMEDYFYNLCKNRYNNSNKTVIFCDRGTMDGKAYVSDEVWQAILEENYWNQIKLSHKRYNAIIHLVTAADGKKEYYTLENNNARSEGIELSIDIDRKIQNSYAGHPKHIIIKNISNQTFNDKINWVFEEVSGIIGLNLNQKYSGNIEKTIYLLKSEINFDNLVIKPTVIKIHKTFLKDNIKKDENGKILEKKERLLSIQKMNQEFNIYWSTLTTINNNKVNQLRKLTSKQFILYKKEASNDYYGIDYLRYVFIINKRVYFYDKIKTDIEGSKEIHLLKRNNLKNICCDDYEELPEEIVELISQKIKDNKIYRARNLAFKNNN